MYIDLRIKVPAIIESICLFFLLRYRKKHYGFAFRRIKLVGSEHADPRLRYTIIDPEDYQKLIKYCWHFFESPKSSHSAVRYYGNNIIYMHRQIMSASKGTIVDHKNRNSLDNRKDNLRFTTASQNACNRETKRGKSKYKGVRVIKENKYRASIMCNRISIHLGYFDNEEDAARAYDEAAKIYHGEFAVLNFNDEPPAEPGLNNTINSLAKGVVWG